ncbi:hypothetical protein AB0D14_42940 [Streptomyces sp. NPDC048484]|uniref:hypothetical protein n=1 Tax=Streptomyces sp. NPDC048484 TaxID=3155146 RepID=UPI0034221F55
MNNHTNLDVVVIVVLALAGLAAGYAAYTNPALGAALTLAVAVVLMLHTLIKK